MGIVSFFKEAGEKLFGKKVEEAPDPQAASDAAGQAIREYINAQGLPGDALQVSFNPNDSIVTVSGAVANQETREKVVLCCGNVDGVAGVADEMSCNDDGQACTYHMVEKGDNLSQIAKEVYGDANKYMVIFEANKPMLSHPDKIYPGQNLRCPTLA